MRRRRHRRRTARRVALALLALPALGAPGCGPGEAPPGDVAAASALPVQARPVESVESYAVDEAFSGRVVGRRSSELGFVRGSLLVAVAVDEGDPVEAGQELARLHTDQLEARRRELEARAASIRSKLALARLTLKRRESLLEKDSISAQRYDEARFEERALSADLAATRASLEAVRAELELSVLKAPYAGTITERWVDEGTVVTPGQPLLRIVESGAMEFRVGLPPRTAEGLEAGRDYPVEVEGRRLEARLETVIPSVEPDTRTVTAVLGFAEPPEGVDHGTLGRLLLRSERPGEGFWLPITALTEGRRGLWSAYVVVENGDGGRHVERRELQLIHVESDRAFVRGTLRDGDPVVTTGLQRLVPGQRVRPVE